MGFPESPSPPHLYPQALQLKLYQAFIFSIPILFSIILFLLFYLFYLKRRTSNGSSPAATLPMRSTQAVINGEADVKGMLKNKLPVILFDEDSKIRDSQCCVCLGEFEIKEELHQLPSCKHIFHVECIRHWLRSNFSCPLCRCHVLVTSKNRQQLETRVNGNSNNNPPNFLGDEHDRMASVSISNISREEHVLVIDELSSASSPSCSGGSTSHAPST